MNDNYLIHHGVKGMKWGIRRYQNKDGTLTAEGRAKYGTVENLKNTYKLERARNISLGIAAIGVGALAGGVAAAFIRKGKMFGSKVLKKGTQIQNMNKGSIEEGKAFFAAFTPEDKKIYGEGYNRIAGMVDARKGPVFKNVATLDEDIKLAGNRQFAKALKKVAPNAGFKMEKMNIGGIEMPVMGVTTSGVSKAEARKFKRALAGGEAPVQLWQRLSPSKREEVQNILLKKGYKGAMDINDKVKGIANSPAIIFKDAKLKGVSKQAVSGNLDNFDNLAAMNRQLKLKEKLANPIYGGAKVFRTLTPTATAGAAVAGIGVKANTSKSKKTKVNGRKR